LSPFFPFRFLAGLFGRPAALSIFFRQAGTDAVADPVVVEGRLLTKGDVAPGALAFHGLIGAAALLLFYDVVGAR
jgi:hypothetical protein